MMREVNVQEITDNIKEMCIEANHFLTDDMKNGIINIYNLYVAGGGTSKASMKKIDLARNITVTIGQD